MGRATRQETERQQEARPLPLPEAKGSLKAFYAGARMASPVGGFLEVLRVHPSDDGSAKVILECSTSSLRFEMPIKKATRTERAKIKQSLSEGADPDCPRHGEGHRLTRAGNSLYCGACGIPFGKAE